MLSPINARSTAFRVQEIQTAGSVADGGDVLTEGTPIRAIFDDFSGECLCLISDSSLPGLRVMRELEVLIARRGWPLMCVSDNG